MKTYSSYATALVMLGLLAACQTRAQHSDVLEAALWPLPADLRAEAAVLQATEADSFRTLRTGQNGLFCVADAPDDDRFSVECHPQSFRPYLERRRFMPRTENSAERDSLLAREIRSGRLAAPFGVLSRFVSGRINPQKGVPDSVWVWSEIYVPFATPEETGLPTEDMGTAPWMMSAGRPGAHVMIGYEQIPWADFQASVEQH